VVFPDAELKIFLTASVEERARRRLQDFKERGRDEISLEQLEQDIQKRDYFDSHRKIAPLQQAIDAIEINTDGTSIEEVTERIIRLYEQLNLRF
jgi:pantoate ligase / CMP/dCMP kinase